MKIAMIGQKGIPVIYGGVERHVQELATRLVERGHQVTVYTRPYYTNPDLREFQGIHLKCLPTWHKKNIDTIIHTFLSTCHALLCNYDIIHYHGVGPSLVSFLPYFFKPRTKIVTTFHAIDRKQAKWGFFAKFMLRLGEWTATHFTDQTIAVSQYLTEYCQQKYPYKPITYIPNGVSKATTYPRESMEAVLRDFSLEKNKYILTVGRLIPDKGIHHLIAAFNTLKPREKLVIVGEGDFDSTYVHRLKNLVEIKDQVVFTGFQKGLPLHTLYRYCSFYVHPSRQEGLPITILEALSYKKAVLASDIPQNREIVEGIGLTFKTGDTTDLKKQLIALLNNPALKSTLGRAGQEHVFHFYNWEDITKNIDKIYMEITTQEKVALAHKKHI